VINGKRDIGGAAYTVVWNFLASISFEETVFLHLLERHIKGRKVCFTRLVQVKIPHNIDNKYMFW
jgi:hypothetical protein